MCATSWAFRATILSARAQEEASRSEFLPGESASSAVNLRKHVPDGMKVFGRPMLLRWSKDWHRRDAGSHRSTTERRPPSEDCDRVKIDLYTRITHGTSSQQNAFLA
jgi:hypothetical protein